MFMVFMLGSMHAFAQSFVGGGVGGVLPTTEQGRFHNSGFLVEAQAGIHKYCNVWPVAMLTVNRFSVRDDIPRTHDGYPTSISLQGQLRYFPWGTNGMPLFGALGTGLSVIPSDADDAFSVGMLGTIEIGYLWHYRNPCCDWFMTFSVRYTAYNMLRDLQRPHLSGVAGVIAIGVPL